MGDGASYPAIADTLRRRPDLPATVLLEHAGATEDAWAVLPPEREGLRIRRLPAGGSLVEAALAEAAAAPAGTRAVIALEGAPTRALSKALRGQHGWAKEQVHALGYWKRH